MRTTAAAINRGTVVQSSPSSSRSLATRSPPSGESAAGIELYGEEGGAGGANAGEGLTGSVDEYGPNPLEL